MTDIIIPNRALWDPNGPTNRHVDNRRIEAQLVKRTDREGFGVAISGGRYVCPLPKGYDHRAVLNIHHDRIIITQEDRVSLLLDPEHGTSTPIFYAPPVDVPKEIIDEITIESDAY